MRLVARPSLNSGEVAAEVMNASTGLFSGITSVLHWIMMNASARCCTP